MERITYIGWAQVDVDVIDKSSMNPLPDVSRQCASILSILMAYETARMVIRPLGN